MANRLTHEEFMVRAREKHGDKHNCPFNENWWNNNYNGMEKTKMKVICPIHGEFDQSISSHLKKRGCSLCGKRKSDYKNKMTYDTFLFKVKKVHGK